MNEMLKLQATSYWIANLKLCDTLWQKEQSTVAKEWSCTSLANHYKMKVPKLITKHAKTHVGYYTSWRAIKPAYKCKADAHFKPKFKPLNWTNNKEA